jgi:hypothetical protein
MVRPLFRPAALAAASMIALLTACGDDDPTGGGSIARMLSLPVGTYRVSTEYLGCDGSPGLTSGSNVVVCRTETLEDFMGVAGCPVEREGNALRIDCQSTIDHADGCTETVRMRFTGSVSGNEYELHGSIRVSDNPADCWDGSYCDSVRTRLVRTGNAPGGCDYADVNEIALSVNDGPLAGKHVLATFGLPSGSGDAIAWTFSGYEWSSATVRSGAPPAGDPPLFVSINTTLLNPADLPITLPVYVAAFQRRAAAGGPEAFIIYNEYSESHRFFATDVTGGSLVVHHLGPDVIAGTLDLKLSGTMERSGGVTTAMRDISGGFHVVYHDPARATTASGGPLSAELGRTLTARRESRVRP